MTRSTSAAVLDPALGHNVCHLAWREYGTDGLTVQPLLDAWPLPFHEFAPVRALPSYKGQKNFTGLLWCSTNSRHVGYESWLERDRLLGFDRDAAVTGIASQPFRLDLEIGGKPCSHVPDYFLKAADGSCLVVDVRPDNHINDHDGAVFSATSTICRSVGWGYQRVGALPRTFAANLHWLAGYKHPRCLNPSNAQRIWARLQPGPLALGSVARAVGNPVTVLPTLFHLIWTSEITTDLQSQPLSQGSMLARRAGP